MKNWTIGKRTIAGFSAVIVISIAMCGVALWRLDIISDAITDVEESSLPSLSYFCTLIVNGHENQEALAKHLLATDKSEMDEVEKEMKKTSAENDQVLLEYKKRLDEGDHQLFEEWMKSRNAYLEVRDKIVIPASRGDDRNAAIEVYKQKCIPAFEKYMKDAYAIFEYNKKATSDEAAEMKKEARMCMRILVGSALLSLVMGIGIAVVITRSTGNVLQSVGVLIQESSTQVASASVQVSSSSQSLAEGASEQAASLEETSASLEEMASMTRRNAENAQSAKELANQARVAADTGASDMARMDSAMLEIKQAGDNIAKIIKTIDEIAFQTNILALNAAVEAARAGEAGMGFAVVADEVRSLAQRSAQAAKETAEKIEDCIRKSEAGVAISSKVGTSLNEILSKATQVDELVAEIATASREQSQGIDQVNTALTQMDKVTQNNAASAEESASAAEELNAQAQALKQAVGDLQQLVGGSSATEASKPVAIRQPSNALQSNSISAQNGTPAHSVNGSLVGNGSAKGYKANGVNGNHGTNGHGKRGQSQPASVSAHNRNVIPLEDEFQDF